MADLVICIGEGKGTWGHAAKVVTDIEWGTVFVITTEYFKGKFTSSRPLFEIIIDKEKDLPGLVEDIRKGLYGKIRGDVALNLVSGSGKEHMAAFSALLRLGVGIRLIALTSEGVKEI